MEWRKEDVGFPMVRCCTHVWVFSSARPVSGVQPVNRGPFRADTGTSVRLQCSITPGALVEQYYVKWHSASDPMRVFYESFPPHLPDSTPISVDGALRSGPTGPHHP